jgi:hypothetical protein
VEQKPRRECSIDAMKSVLVAEVKRRWKALAKHLAAISDTIYVRETGEECRKQGLNRGVGKGGACMVRCRSMGVEVEVEER